MLDEVEEGSPTFIVDKHRRWVCGPGEEVRRCIFVGGRTVYSNRVGLKVRGCLQGEVDVWVDWSYHFRERQRLSIS